MSRPPLHIALAIAATVLLSTGTAAASPAPGGAWGWGDNADGQLGNGTITRYGGEPVAVQVKNLTNVQALAGGSNFSVALKTDGTVWAWGNNGWGQLGQGNYQSSTVPLQVPGLRGVRAIAAGALTGLALQSDGTVKAWGFNYYGQVGDGVSGPNELSPVSVRGLTGVVAVAAGP